jgi:hypothetical protein
MSARQHQGTAQQQLDALDRLARETAADLAAVKAALIVIGILPVPRSARAVSDGVSRAGEAGMSPPDGYPPSRRHGMRVVQGGAR